MCRHVRDKNVLVTGATGFIGSHLVKRLLREGAMVHALVRNTKKAKRMLPDVVRIIRGDMTDSSSLHSAVKGQQVIYHLAAALAHLHKPMSTFRKVNVEGTRHLAEASLDHDVDRFIYISSVAVYGHDTEELVDERSPHRKSNAPYSDTKIEAEDIVRTMCQERGLPSVIVQPSHTYGTGECAWTTVPLKLMKYGLMFLPDHGNGFICPLYIDDLVEGMLKAGEQGMLGESYILAGSKTVTSREYFRYLLNMSGRKKMPSLSKKASLALAEIAEMITVMTKIPIFTKEAARIAMARTRYSIEKAKRELNFLPETDLDEGMRRVREYVKSLKQKH
jgi:nucleoside-diphosphate-sugar epimerase